jgi:hypothetical protein
MTVSSRSGNYLIDAIAHGRYSDYFYIIYTPGER